MGEGVRSMFLTKEGEEVALFLKKKKKKGEKKGGGFSEGELAIHRRGVAGKCWFLNHHGRKGGKKDFINQKGGT